MRRDKPSSMRALGADDEADMGQGRGRDRQADGEGGRQAKRQPGRRPGRWATLCSQAGTLPGRQGWR